MIVDEARLLRQSVDLIAELAALPPARVGAMRAALARHGHRLHYAAVDTSRLPSSLHGASGDAFDIAMTRAATLARERDRRRSGAAQQAGAGAQVAEQVRAHRRFALAAADGQCFGSSGSFSPQACGINGTGRGAAGSRRAPQFSVLTSGEECVRRCEECPRCGFASFSLLLRRCTWHGPTGCDIARLEHRWELWSYSTVRVRNVSLV